MTPEQWEHINARLLALEAFVTAIGRTINPNDALRREVAKQKEVSITVLLHAPISDPYGEEIHRRFERLSLAILGPE